MSRQQVLAIVGRKFHVWKPQQRQQRLKEPNDGHLIPSVPLGAPGQCLLPQNACSDSSSIQPLPSATLIVSIVSI
eukprot:scaffold92666_cov18-Tisochrysis_lutea.AAC.3